MSKRSPYSFEFRAGDYEIHPETILTGARLVANAIRTNLWGMPRLSGTAAEIARQVVAANAEGRFLIAGQGHFRYFWISDFGKSIRGLLHILPRAYLLEQVNRFLDAAIERGRVPTCLSEERTFDLPYARADGLPWLVHAMDTLDPTLLRARREPLERLTARWIDDHFEPGRGLMRGDVRGDWMDTIRRPSSTYNNLLALNLFETLARHNVGGEVVRDRAEQLARDLVDARWTGSHFTDYEAAPDYLSADANAPALYFGLFEPARRRKMVDAIESSGLLRPVPIRISDRIHGDLMPLFTRFTPAYHSSAWLHMGLLYVAGLKRQGGGSEVDEHLGAVENLVEREGNFVEVVDRSGFPYRTPLHTSEHGLTMAAALYVEAREAASA